MTTKTKTTDEALQLAIQVEGKIIKSNFDDFRKQAESQIESINFDLKTDEDFGQAKQDADGLKSFEETLTDAEDRALKEMDEVYALITGTRELKDLARKTRLELEKMVKAKTEEIKRNLIQEGIDKLSNDCRQYRSLVTESIKGKRNLTTMKEAIAETVKHCNGITKANREIIANAKEKHGSAVAFSEGDLLVMDTSNLQTEIERRVERIEAEAERQRLIREAEEAKAKMEATKQPEAPQNEPQEQPEAKQEQAKQPEPPKCETETEEMARFKQTVLTSFGTVKTARASLKHQNNKDKAESFAQAIAQAWKEFTA